MVQVRTLTDITLEAIFNAWADAFSDYERSWTYEELEKMLQRRSFNADLSFGAFDGDKLVGFILNGTGTFNELRTTYDTGTGIVKERRGKGLTTFIFNKSLPVLRSAGMQQYLLEVLSNNETAINIYTKAGFKTRRILNYYVQPVSEIQLLPKKLPAGYILRDISINDLKDSRMICEFSPAWQNSLSAIANKPENFKIIGVYYNNELVGYGIIEPSAGDVPQLVVAAIHRRKGIGTTLLTTLNEHNRHSTLRFINTDAACFSVAAFLMSNAIGLSGTQLEMMLNITAQK
jgi:ribosomal protein S18 acetylase RimI-like enzyme